MTVQSQLAEPAKQVLDLARRNSVKIATAESCTGGLIAAALTEIAGSSDVFDRGFVTYSNEAKSELVGVPMGLIAEHGAVSGEVAKAMAKGALARSAASLAVAVTGIAGPGGGTAEKPVGLVWLAVAKSGGEVNSFRRNFTGKNRTDVRLLTVLEALRLLAHAIDADEARQDANP